MQQHTIATVAQCRGQTHFNSPRTVATHRDRLDDVLAGLAAARAAGLAPVKVNAVLMRGVNEDEAVPMLQRALEEDWQLRFIEQMPLDAGGLWNRASGAPPFQAAPRLLAARDRIDPDTILNMTVSSDTIGGSSGSPVITERMEILGANFDSTVMSQRNAYGYDRNFNRSVIVTTGAVTAALRDVYGMERLVAELGVR